MELKGLNAALHDQANKEAEAIIDDALLSYRLGTNGLKETFGQSSLFKV